MLENNMLSNNIILIGFMGSGKSSIGKRLAKELHYDYCDTDHLVEAEVGMSIKKLIEQEGEAFFRTQESHLLKKLLGRKNTVFATGGGIILDPQNQTLLRQLGKIIWLHATPDVLFERAQRTPSRPLLEVEHPRRTFNHLLLARILIYQSLSHLKIDTTYLSYEQTLTTILKEWNNYKIGLT